MRGCLLDLTTMAAEQGNTKTLLGARASLKKRPGYLYLTDEPHRLVWMDEQGSVPEIHSYVWDVKGLYSEMRSKGLCN